MNRLVCLVCGKKLHLACPIRLPEEDPENRDVPPRGAVAFQSRGEYGSAVWGTSAFGQGRPRYLAEDDPDECLEVLICDECLIKNANHVQHRELERQIPRYRHF